MKEVCVLLADDSESIRLSEKTKAKQVKNHAWRDIGTQTHA
jgi:hypothetical protein